MTDPNFPGCVTIVTTQMRAESLSRHLAMANACWMCGDRVRYDRFMGYAMEAMSKIADDRDALLKEQRA